jgi:hypothetical protein
VRRLPADLVLGAALLLVAIVGRSCLEPAEVPDARPYVGSWTTESDGAARTLVVEPDHRAVLDGQALTWRLLRPVPSRIPPPPSLAVDLPGGATLTADRQGEDLVTWDGKVAMRWKRAP